MTDADMTELIQEFLVECDENLNRLDQELIALERDPRDAPTLASIFRTIHTVKGSAGLIGLPKMEALAHAGESLLALLRAGELLFDAELATAVLALVDAIREMLRSLAAGGGEGDGDYRALEARLVQLQSKERGQEKAQALPVDRGSPVHEDHDVAQSNVRVDVGLLDRLMNLVGELVLARNQVVRFTVTRDFASLDKTVQRLDLVTSELQETAMKTRMQPIGNAWAKLPRVVRDLAHALGKEVRVAMEGTETELDKTLLEAIKDPLLHAVRNAVDHGIELPEARSAAGKPREGRLSLRAFHEGGQVIVEISDDGAGIDLDRVREKAVEKGLIAKAEAARLDEREVLQLIFLAGFSTADKVTNVSGRGVGMDVVRTNIERIGGTVEISSVRGGGTTLRIRIPLTLAIIPALIVRSAGERFAIPQVNLLELLRLEGAELRRIEQVGGAPVYRLRGELLPLLNLAKELSLPVEVGRELVNIVVVQADQRRFGLVVDDIEDTQEIVVKPLANLLRGQPAFAGATIMGDGQVALILDVVDLARRGSFAARSKTTATAEPASSSAQAAPQKLLLCGAASGARVAIPLASVARLEEFPESALERAGGDVVVQYRGGILPLLFLADLAGGSRAREAPPLVDVVVFADAGRTLGLVVDHVFDIVEESFALERRSSGGVFLGSAVIGGRVTELLDAGALLGA